ncbi:hypothetical protein WD019_03000 [Fictibacillus sp. Mic-4]
MPDSLGYGMYLFQPETDPKKVKEAAKAWEEWCRKFLEEHYPEKAGETA